MNNFEGTRGSKLFFSTALAGLVCSLVIYAAGFAQTGNVYVDPRQHFTVQVPTGWVAKPYNTGGASGVTIAHGTDAYVQIFLQKGNDPATFLKTINSGLQTIRPGYRVSYQGLRTVDGQSRSFIVGESPETLSAPRTRVYLETFAANGFSYAIIASSSDQRNPGRDLMVDYKISQELIQSLMVKTARGQVTHAAAAPPPVAAQSAASAAGASDNSGAVLSPRDQKRLAALDSALRDGAVSEEEFQIKKIALYSSALERRDRSALLKSLNQAYEEGVLTREEYRRKKEAMDAGVSPSPGWPDATHESKLSPPEPVESAPARIATPPAPLPISWTTHNDPAGFAVSLPPAWTVDKATETGQIILRGNHGEEILIWPLHLLQPDLDSQGASAMVQEFARKFDALMPWSTVQSMPNAARVMGLGPERSASALLSWANGPATASVYFYGIEAPGEVYRNSTDTFLAILKSFRIVQDSTFSDAAGTAIKSDRVDSGFESWSDPHEGAFSVAIPKGWQVAGGAYRLSAEDARYSAVMISPDGRVRESMGDAMIGTFTQPTHALALAGLGEGSFQTLPDGTRMEILRYSSGQQFARSYVETLVSRQCGNLQIESTSARDDLASTLTRTAEKEGFTDEFLTAGEVSFSCSVDGRAARGKYIAATMRTAPAISSMWFVYRLYGYIAFAGREVEGENVLAEMLRSANFNPDEVARQRDAPIGSEQKDMDRSLRMRETAQQHIADDQKLISEMMANAEAQRQKIYDQIDRKLDNSIIGRLTLVDPETAMQYKVSAFGDYHFLTNDGYFYSTNPSARLASNLRALVALP